MNAGINRNQCLGSIEGSMQRWCDRVRGKAVQGPRQLAVPLRIKGPILSKLSAYLAADAVLPPVDIPPDDDESRFAPFESASDFEITDLLYHGQHSKVYVDKLMRQWLLREGQAPFANNKDLLTTIDDIPHGDIPWQGFAVNYTGKVPENVPAWMTATYDLWFRNPLQLLEAQLGNADFANKMDYAPKQILDKNKHRQYSDLMLGNWDTLAEDENNHGAMLVPVVVGSDKTTVSVATGQNEYYPFYAGIGNVWNNVHKGHHNVIGICAFLAIPKTDKQNKALEEFRRFRRQLFYTSLTRILRSLWRWMSTPRVTKCADGHFCRAIYSLGPYIANYPEQALLACVINGWCPRCTAPANDLDRQSDNDIPRSHEHTDLLMDTFSNDLKILWEGYGIIGDVEPFTNNFPHANIHELLTPDLLHQVIKGCFKDHLVDWITSYINKMHNDKTAKEILTDIDRRIAAVPSFPGVHQISEGHGFRQWTGADSKALMKVCTYSKIWAYGSHREQVYLPAIEGHIPAQMVCAVRAFLKFCYLVHCATIDEATLDKIKVAVKTFHTEREIFCNLNIRADFNRPQQHAIMHYRHLIQEFGAPNGVCSSSTENKHIHAVKKPYQRSNKNKPLGQMITTNQQLDRLAAAHVYFETRGMLTGQVVPPLGMCAVPLWVRP
ncbi:hypothetical protein CPB85DRAFT_1257048 [Mucidula mucida]|nr:hypothetical protein CPB85DRAFT_1257048 [Mucidula mucida]